MSGCPGRNKAEPEIMDTFTEPVGRDHPVRRANLLHLLSTLAPGLSVQNPTPGACTWIPPGGWGSGLWIRETLDSAIGTAGTQKGGRLVASPVAG